MFMCKQLCLIVAEYFSVLMLVLFPQKPPFEFLLVIQIIQRLSRWNRGMDVMPYLHKIQLVWSLLPFGFRSFNGVMHVDNALVLVATAAAVYIDSTLRTMENKPQNLWYSFFWNFRFYITCLAFVKMHETL